jgi:hypothetical protein
MSDLIASLSSSISTASTLCAEIKKTRHIGHSHTQLDLLEASLASGPSFPSGTGSSSFSSTASSELESYVSRMGEINARLEQIAHPKNQSHGSKHGHHHQRHEHKEMEDPHFGDMRAAWEALRDGVEKLLEAKGGGVEEVSQSVEVKLEVKHEVKSAETKEVEAKTEGKPEKKEEAKMVEKKETVEVKVDEVHEAKDVKA